MKRIIIISLLSLVIIGCGGTNNTSVSLESLSPEEVNTEIESLREFIIPPKGVSKADVNTVFGVPEVINELTGKGSANMYPMHIYQLLSPKQGQEYRAYLQVTYEADKAKYISISHYCVVRGRATYPKDEIERENRLVLEDLLEIKKNYGSELEDASWNNNIRAAASIGIYGTKA